MKTLVVIVNYRTPALVVDCLRSLAPELTPGSHVIVTDNLSPDDSVDQIYRAIDENGWGDWCTFLRLPKNGGFAYGNNEAIGQYFKLLYLADRVNQDEPRKPQTPWPGEKFDYVWLLNPDTIVLPGALLELEKFLDATPSAGIAAGGRKIVTAASGGAVSGSSHRWANSKVR